MLVIQNLWKLEIYLVALGQDYETHIKHISKNLRPST